MYFNEVQNASFTPQLANTFLLATSALQFLSLLLHYAIALSLLLFNS